MMLKDILTQVGRQKEVKEPNWEARERVHDWRNHVPPAFMKEWKTLTAPVKGAVYLIADEAADWEEWD